MNNNHKGTVADENSNEMFSDEFDFNTSTKPIPLNETGRLTYSESDVNTEDPIFVMADTITVNDYVVSGFKS